MTDSIVVRDVSKKFTLRYHRTLKQMAMAAARRQDISDTFLALDDVSFTVEQGESIGLMGLNGSGKSTLLKLINGIMRPDGGQVLTRGRIAGLIATGAGFHPQLTGRDNIYLNAAVLGMSEAETRRKFDAIVDFADVGKHLDSQVGHYSSGMFATARLRRGHPRRQRHLPRRRGAGGGGPALQAEVPGARCRRSATAAAPSSTSATPPDRCAGCVTGCSSWRRAGVGFDGAVDAGIKYIEYDTDATAPEDNEDEELGADV